MVALACAAAGTALALPTMPDAQTTDSPPAAAAAPSGDGEAAERGRRHAKPTARALRRGYASWRRKLRRLGAYTGRNLLRLSRAADGARRHPTARALRRSIQRMQRRLANYLRTPRGRAAAYRLKVRRIPGWGRGQLRSIAWCESKNDARAIGGGGAYRGLYQFSFGTWRIVGGRGDPAAAPRPEQTWRAWLLLRRHGSGHWPVCG